MVSENVIRKKLERLEESIRRLKSKQKVLKEEFIKNWEIHNAILREFEVAIECCVDIGTHIISEKGWESPEKYRDVAEILAKNNVIPQAYAEVLKKMISFRNLIVHEYLGLDLEKVYENLQRIEDLKKFAEYIEEFLEKEK